MKIEVTRNVVSDLWPLCRSGEASAESRALVEAYLAQDEAFAAMLKASESQAPVVPLVGFSPDPERRLLEQARDRARMKWLVIGGAVGLGGIVLLVALAAVLILFFRGGVVG